MRIAHIYPSTDLLMDLFVPHSKHEFVDEGIDDGCDLIFCGSVTQISRAWHAKMEVKHKLGRDIPLVCWVWDLPINWRSWCRTDDEHDENIWRDNKISMNLSLLWQCAGIISASKYTRGVLEMFGLKSRQEYFYIDVDGLDAIEDPPERVNRAIQISRYALNKRFDLTIDVWAELQDEYPDWELMFIGTGDVDSLRERAEEKGLKNYTFHENIARHQTIKLLKESKILVQPSVFEGFGLTPPEAMHCGVATVCSDIPPAIECDYADWMFSKDDLGHYAEMLKDCMTQTAQNGRAPTPQSDLTPQAFAARFDKALEEML